MKRDGAREGATKVNADVDTPQQLGTGGEAARAGHAAGEDGDTEREWLAGESPECGGVEVEGGG